MSRLPRRFIIPVTAFVLALALAVVAASGVSSDSARGVRGVASADSSATRALAVYSKRRTVSPNVTVTLIGRIKKKTYDFDGQTTRRVPVIVLSKAINVRADDFDGPAKKVKTMQLAINGNYKSFMKKHLGHKVKLTGQLYYGNTVHHFTRVLVDVKRAKNR